MTAHVRVTSQGVRIETITGQLRFVQRGTSRVLQQLILWVSDAERGEEWRDVPMVTEGK